MKMLALVFLLALSNSIYARDVGGDFAVLGIGQKTCADYLQARRAHGVGEQEYVAWLLGYASAFNLIVDNTYNILGSNDINDILGWLDRQCLTTPKEHFVNATAAMTEVLFPRRANLHPDKAGGPNRWRQIAESARGDDK
jgi:hypothetical protein